MYYLEVEENMDDKDALGLVDRLATILAQYVIHDRAEHMFVTELHENSKIALAPDTTRQRSFHFHSNSPSGVFFSYREIFSLLLSSNIRSCVLAHNHPIGTAEFSVQDKRVIREMTVLGSYLGIRSYHVVYGKGLVGAEFCDSDEIFLENKFAYYTNTTGEGNNKKFRFTRYRRDVKLNNTWFKGDSNYGS